MPVTIITLFIISLIGSTHCAGMCGGFATFCGSAGETSWPHHLAYNGGRLLVYLLLGCGAGVIGLSLDSVGIMTGLSHFSALLLGVIFIAFGCSRLFERNLPFGDHIGKALHRKIFSRYLSLARRVGANKSWFRPLAVGFLSALLPCGWLYSYVAAAGATASVAGAATTMFVFWLGTLPMMLSIGKLSRFALQRWGLEVSKLSAALLVVAGLLAIAGHLGNPLQVRGAPGQELQCH